MHEWEVPFDFPEDWPASAAEPFDAFHAARQAMQTAMDESIAAHAEQETLYDKPEIDKNKLRITGPFTVEAVPSRRCCRSTKPTPPKEADVAIARSGETSRQRQWRDELLKTGIRGKGGQMLEFAELETLPGTALSARLRHAADTGERVVVSFGPEHAALEQRQVELALREAEQTLCPAPEDDRVLRLRLRSRSGQGHRRGQWPGVTAAQGADEHRPADRGPEEGALAATRASG